MIYKLNWKIVNVGIMLLAGTTSMVADTWEKKRAKALARPLKVIYNNDGNDVYLFPKKLSPTSKNFLNVRSTPMLGTNIDAVFYCPGSAGFTNMFYRTQAGSMLLKNWPQGGTRFKNIMRDLLKNDTDPLQEIVNFCKKHNYTVFMSQRMNDCHDCCHRPEKPDWLFPPYKKKNPHLLMSPHPDKRQGLAPWAVMDYTHKEVRDKANEIFVEVCKNYDVDGVELDFAREPYIFKSVSLGGKASPRELGMTTDMMRKLRQALEKIGKKRGRPILIAIKVPDSLDYCRAIGLDVESWMKEGLIDIFVGGIDFFRLTPQKELALTCHKYGIKYYPATEYSRIKGKGFFSRYSYRCYKGQSAASLLAGADGNYYFNLFYKDQYDNCMYGDLKDLEQANKIYFATIHDWSPSRYLKNGDKYLNSRMPQISAKKHVLIKAKPTIIELELGDNFPVLLKKGIKPLVSCFLKIPNANKSKLELKVNGRTCEFAGATSMLQEFKIDPQNLQAGMNRFSVSTISGQKQAVTILSGKKKLVYGKNQKPWRRLFLAKDLKSTEKIIDGAYQFADMSGGNYMANLLYPLPQGKIDDLELSFDAKFVNGDDPRATCLRIANGDKVEIFTLTPDAIGLLYARKSYKLNTRQKFCHYLLKIKNQRIKVYVDGRLTLNAPLKISIHDSQSKIRGSHDINSEMLASSLIIGSISGSGKGTSLWKNVTLSTSARTLTDFAITVTFPSKKDCKMVNKWQHSMSFGNKVAAKWKTIGNHENFRNGPDFWEISTRNREKQEALITTPKSKEKFNQYVIFETTITIQNGTNLLAVSNGAQKFGVMLEPSGFSSYFWRVPECTIPLVLQNKKNRYRLEIKNGKGYFYINNARYLHDVPLVPVDRVNFPTTAKELTMSGGIIQVCSPAVPRFGGNYPYSSMRVYSANITIVPADLLGKKYASQIKKEKNYLVNYNATLGKLPNAEWKNHYGKLAKIIQDGSDKNVLRLNNSSNNKYAIWNWKSANKLKFDKNQLYVLEFKIKSPNENTVPDFFNGAITIPGATPQDSYSISVPLHSNRRLGNSFGTYELPTDNQWHEFKCIIDVDSSRIEFWRDGHAFSVGKLRLGKQKPGLWFGDGSGITAGICLLEYFRLKTVIKE